MSAGTAIQVRLPDEDREALDAWRRQQPNPPSRAQAVRALFRDALGLRLGEEPSDASSGYGA
jgi:hypothetical protein